MAAAGPRTPGSGQQGESGQVFNFDGPLHHRFLLLWTVLPVLCLKTLCRTPGPQAHQFLPPTGASCQNRCSEAAGSGQQEGGTWREDATVAESSQFLEKLIYHEEEESLFFVPLLRFH